MVTIELGAVPAVPRGSFRDAVDWARIIVGTAARGLIMTLLGLALWAAAPAVIGWHPTTVMTGSMEPRLAPGDVVVSRPVDPSQLRLGQVVLYDDPDQVGELRLHRIHALRPGNMLITKGDANPQADSTPISRSVVHGVAFIRVPYVGLPILWLRDGQWHRLVLLVLALTVIAWLATIDGSLRRVADTSGPDTGREARDEPEPSLPTAVPESDTVTRRDRRRRQRRARALRRVGTGLAVVLLVGGAGVLLPGKALAAGFGGTTTNPVSTLTATSAVAASAITCTNNADKTVTLTWTYAGAALVGFDVLSGSTVVASTTGATTSVKISGSGSNILNLGTTMTLSVRTNLTSTWTKTSTATAKVTTTDVLGSISATCG
jgi:signal peptidase